jgi:hypothetical protein
MIVWASLTFNPGEFNTDRTNETLTYGGGRAARSSEEANLKTMFGEDKKK